jgi:hypothetical protein
MRPRAPIWRVTRPCVETSGRSSTGPPSAGMQVFLDTDMLTVTPPLFQCLRRIAPGRGPADIDASNPRVWEIYRAGLDELEGRRHERGKPRSSSTPT